MKSELDKLLVTAALARPIEANAAWKKWRSAVEPKDAPHVLSWAGGYIYLNLKNLGIEDPYLRGIFRHNFLANNYRLSQVKATVNKLARNWEISPIKSFGMSVADNSLGLRPIADFDFYLEGSRAVEVFEFLQSQGYKSNLDIEIFEFKTRHFKRRGSWNFVNSEGFDLDLHWRLFDHLSIKDNQALLEGNSQILETKHGKFRMLSPDLMSVLIINHHLLSASSHYSGLFDIARVIAQSNLRIVSQLASRIGISREMREVLQVIDEHSKSSHVSKLETYAHGTKVPAKTLLIRKSTDYELIRHRAIYKAWNKLQKPLWIEEFITKYCGGFVKSDVAKLNLFQGARLGSGWHYQYPLDKHRWLNIGDSRFTFLHPSKGDYELDVSFDAYLFTLLSHIERLNVFANGKQIGVIEKSHTSSIFKYSVDRVGKIEFSIRSQGQSAKEVAGFDFNWRLLSLPLLSIQTRPLNGD